MKRILVLLALCAFSAGLSQDINKIADSYINENGVEIIDQFRELLAIPNVAFDLPNINKNAEYIQSQLEIRSVETKLLRMVGTPPIIYGYYPVKNATRTLAFYVHYDGQPVDKSKWTNDPWKPTYYSDAIFNGGKPMDFPKKSDDMEKVHWIGCKYFLLFPGITFWWILALFL